MRCHHRLCRQPVRAAAVPVQRAIRQVSRESRIVGSALTGWITDDAGMLDLLAPFAGHRYRVAMLLGAGGLARPGAART